jgi:hypothetical protein
MKATSNDKLIAYLALFSGLAISAVAIYYSVMGLVAIYPAMVIPIVIMGVVIEIGKLSATVWLKQSWAWAPIFLKAYILPAIAMLMFITSIGVFGFLSKAHSDQSLVSGDVQAKISVYDEKIKVAKDNIDANRKALKQMDEAVDQVMGRSADEKGADKAVAIRRGQAKERTRLLSDIAAEQKTITQLSEERAPIAAEVRKVEAEVGPIKYIAALMYGDNPDTNVLEKAVTWVTILIVVVLDPMAVVLLLASQYSFQRIRALENPEEVKDKEFEGVKDPVTGKWIQTGPEFDSVPVEKYQADNGTLTDEQIDQINAMLSEHTVVLEPEVPELEPVDNYAYLNTGKSFWAKPEGWVDVPPQVYTPEKEPEVPVPVPVDQWNAMIAEAEAEAKAEADKKYQIIPELVKKDDRPEFDFASLPVDQEYVNVEGSRMHIRAAKDLYKQTITKPDGYIQNEEQQESGAWNRVISEAEYRDRAVTVTKPNDPKNNPNNPA